LIDLARDYEHSSLPDRQKAALRFCDAFLSCPQRFDAADRAELERHFSTEEIVVLLWKVLSHTTNKPVIALELDAPMDPDRLSEFSYSEKGEFVLHLPGGEADAVGFVRRV
jgi:hypothetical protein